MIVTMEELENGKWCPDARAKLESSRDNAATNRINDPQNKSVKAGSIIAARCIGPECMAWRWHKVDVSGYCGRGGTVSMTVDIVYESAGAKQNSKK